MKNKLSYLFTLWLTRYRFSQNRRYMVPEKHIRILLANNQYTDLTYEQYHYLRRTIVKLECRLNIYNPSSEIWKVLLRDILVSSDQACLICSNLMLRNIPTLQQVNQNPTTIDVKNRIIKETINQYCIVEDLYMPTIIKQYYFMGE